MRAALAMMALLAAALPAVASADSVRSKLFDELPVWTGDVDVFYERGVLRVATTFSRSHFFLDGGRPRGVSYELLSEFEKTLNEGRGLDERVNVIFLPLPRDELLAAVASGRADIAAARLSDTPERRRSVDFSVPFAGGVRELVVTGPGAPDLQDLDDLAGRTVHVRASSSYFETLSERSRGLVERGLAPIEIVPVDELLETEDILELVAAGTFPVSVADNYIAALWADVLDGLVVRDDLALGEDRAIAWAIRKDSPQLAEAIADFAVDHRRGTLFGNVVINRYYKGHRMVRNALAPDDLETLLALTNLFEAYASRFGVDWLLAAAQGYQESRFDQSVRSSAGAIGIMQLKPSTAADPNVGVENIERLENNIHAGIKYLAFIRDRYFDDPAIGHLDRHLLALAAYNAGPARIRQYRDRAAELGLDPNRWFRNVEQVSNAETVIYVRNIFKYFVSYREYRRRIEAAGLPGLDRGSESG